MIGRRERGTLGRRLLWLVVSLSGILIAPGRSLAQAPPARDGWNAPAIDAWLGVVERHTPGELDAALLEAAAWTRDDLRVSWVGLSVLLRAVSAPKQTTFDVLPFELALQPKRGLALWEGPGRPPPRAIRVKFDRRRRRELEPLVARATALGVRALLTRAVVVHTDIVTLVPEFSRASSEPALGAAMRLNAGDGTSTGMNAMSVHWEVARLLLTLLPASDQADHFACTWYRATVALGHHGEFFDPGHLRLGLARCPDDPGLLFLAGAEREALASPFFQAFAQSARKALSRLEIGDAETELEAAERYYRRALARDASLVEARLRLGRVLTLREKPDEAVVQIRQALDASREPVLEYLGTLFLGAALEATGQLELARDAYRRASESTPLARVPQLGLARVLFRLGDASGMAAALDDAVRLNSDDDAGDPWWAYRGLHARQASAMLARTRALAIDQER